MTVVLGLAAFCAYFAMYAFRKPFAAALFADQDAWGFRVDYKTLLLIAQVLGYALSKIIGIRVIAEFGRHGRARAILALIGFSWLALVAFAWIPAPWNLPCLFLNGLPLGMIWGLVYSYLEGRRTSEVLGAMLCASFILASGVVKTVGQWLLDAGVSEYWMPAVTGLVFAPLLPLSLWILESAAPPDHEDERERIARTPMRRSDRVAYLRDYGLAILLLVLGYILLTALRDFRDGFAADIWTELGYTQIAALFSQSELPIAVIVLLAMALLMRIRNNLRALMAMHGMVIFGGLLLGISTVAFQHRWLDPLPWMILTGLGLFLAYTPFNAMLFDRMIAVIGRSANAGFLIYLADASGYVGSVALLLYRSLGTPDLDPLAFFIDCALWSSVVITGMTVISALYFHVRGPRHGVVATA